jgi:hypothetical protein
LTLGAQTDAAIGTPGTTVVVLKMLPAAEKLLWIW